MTEVINDYELIYFYQLGSQDAFEQLAFKYKPLIFSQINNFHFSKYLYGYSYDDLLNEAFIVLFECINSYCPYSVIQFSTYFINAFKNRMCAIIRRNKLDKNKAMAHPFSLDTHYEDDDNSYLTLLEDTQYGVYEQVSNQMELLCLSDYLHAQLTKNERRVMYLYLDEYPYKDISKRTGLSTKKIDNTLTKIKKIIQKYKTMYNN